MLNRVEIKKRAKIIYQSNAGKAIVIGLLLWLFSEGGGSTGEYQYLSFDLGTLRDLIINFRTSHFWALLGFAGLFAAILGLVVSIILSPVKTMLMYYYKDMSDNIANPNIMEAIERGAFGKLIVVTIVSDVIIGIATLFFVIPGIYLEYRWRYVGLICIDQPQLTIQEIFEESNRLTNGSKWELVILDLSFIGWLIVVSILGIISFGILGFVAGVILTPYTALSDIEAYKELKLKKQSVYY